MTLPAEEWKLDVEGQTSSGREFGWCAPAWTLYVLPLRGDKDGARVVNITDPYRLAGLLRDIADSLAPLEAPVGDR